MPLVGAAIGYWTNVLAVILLFRPLEPVGPAWLRLQGVIPRRRRELTAAIAVAVRERLMPPGVLAERLRSPDMQGAAVMTLLTVFDEEVTARFPLFALPLARTLRSGVGRLAAVIVRRLAEAVEERAVESLDLEALVRTELDELSLDELEAVIRGVAGKELRAIELLGALAGLLIGSAQALVTLLLRA